MCKLNVIKYIAVPVLAVYLLGLAGFNVHCCKESGETFVASLMGSTNCHDFHPDHHCHSVCCDAKADCHETVLSATDCCSSEILLLTFSGDIPDRDFHPGHHHCTCHCGHCPADIEALAKAEIPNSSYVASLAPCIFLNTFSEERAVLNIWRL